MTHFSDAPTAVIPVPPKAPEPSMLEKIADRPGYLTSLVGELVLTTLVIAGGFAVLFLLAFGCYALMQVAP